MLAAAVLVLLTTEAQHKVLVLAAVVALALVAHGQMVRQEEMQLPT
jgi:hypothetical protein